jgi:hypothetical protein
MKVSEESPMGASAGWPCWRRERYPQKVGKKLWISAS